MLSSMPHVMRAYILRRKSTMFPYFFQYSVCFYVRYHSLLEFVH